MNTYIDDSWLDLQANGKFIRYVLTDADGSIRGRLHRTTLRSIIIYFGSEYLDLKRSEIRKIYYRCLSQQFADMQLHKVDTVSVNLHRHFFEMCKKRMFDYLRQLRQQAVAESRRVKE